MVNSPTHKDRRIPKLFFSVEDRKDCQSPEDSPKSVLQAFSWASNETKPRFSLFQKVTSGALSQGKSKINLEVAKNDLTVEDEYLIERTWKPLQPLPEGPISELQPKSPKAPIFNGQKVLYIGRPLEPIVEAETEDQQINVATVSFSEVAL